MDKVVQMPRNVSSARFERGPWGAVFVVTLLYALNKIDTIIMAPLGTPIKQTFGLSDFELSLLMGPTFAIFYGICGVPMGSIVDRRPIRLVMFIGIAVWSIATGACGLVTSFTGLIIARMMVGVGEATLTPAVYLMISSKFTRERRTLPLSVYATGSSIGIGAGIAIGGYAAGAAMAGGGAHLPLVGWVSAWQIAFIALGVIGVMMAPLAFTVPEPTRGERLSAAPAPSTASVMRHVVADRRRYVPLFALFFMMSVGGVSAIIWLPIYVTRILGWDHSSGGLWLGVLFVACGTIGHMISGYGIDWYHRRGGINGSVRFAMLAAIISMPALMIAVLLGNPLLFWLLITIPYILFIPWSAYGVAALLEITPLALRGRISALFLLICSAGGQVVGPTMVGAFNDFLFRDEAKLGLSLAAVAGLSLVAVLAIGGFIIRTERNSHPASMS